MIIGTVGSLDFIKRIASVEIDPGDATVKPNLEYVLIRGFSSMGWAQPTLAAHQLMENIAQSLVGDRCEKCGCELNGEAALIEATDEIWCHSCADNAAEAAYERQCSDFYGGAGPLPLAEQQRRAKALK